MFYIKFQKSKVSIIQVVSNKTVPKDNMMSFNLVHSISQRNHDFKSILKDTKHGDIRKIIIQNKIDSCIRQEDLRFMTKIASKVLVSFFIEKFKISGKQLSILLHAISHVSSINIRYCEIFDIDEFRIN